MGARLLGVIACMGSRLEMGRSRKEQEQQKHVGAWFGYWVGTHTHTYIRKYTSGLGWRGRGTAWLCGRLPDGDKLDNNIAHIHACIHNCILEREGDMQSHRRALAQDTLVPPSNLFLCHCP